MITFHRFLKTVAILWLIGLCLLLLPRAETALAAVGSPDDFVITVDTTQLGPTPPNQFTIPTYPGETYNFNVDCNNDGLNEANEQTTDYTCDYTSLGGPGIYTIRIKDNAGDGTGFPRIYFNSGGDKFKLLTVDQWGTGKWTSMESAFRGCYYLTLSATDMPDLSLVTDMSYMFKSAISFNGDIGGWDTSNVTNMSWLFVSNYDFNQDIGSWETSNVTDMSYMFWDASVFNQDLSNWNTSKVTNMNYMFNATAFDQDLSSWDVSAVETADLMFTGVKLSIANYDALLNSWSTQPLQNDVFFGGGNSTYCLGETARQSIIDTYGWTITDGGKDCPDTTPPDASFLAPVSGGSLLQPRAYLLVDATDAGDGMKEVQFYGYYGNAWHFLATDDDGSDGWGYTWTTYNITDAFVKVKAIAIDNNNNQTPIEMDNVPLTVTITTSGGYQARGGNLQDSENSEENLERPTSENLGENIERQTPEIHENEVIAPKKYFSNISPSFPWLLNRTLKYLLY